MQRVRLPDTRQSQRRGVTAVELAIMAPLIFFLFFSLIEFSRANMMRHAVASAAFEGARTAIVPGATADDARTAALKMLKAVAAINTDVTVDPATITDKTPTVTVTVEVLLDDNAWVVPKFFRGGALTSSVTLARERTELFVY
jgi:Flp pilus assembly protein TadG